MAILSKACKPDNFESHNFLKLSFTNIWGLCSNFVDCESFLESSSPDIFALCETNLDDSIDSGNFFVSGCLPLIQKDSSIHVHGLAVYVKEGLPFALDLSLEKSTDFYFCLWLALLHWVSYVFFFYWSPSSYLCMVSYSIYYLILLFCIDEVFSINLSANVFMFGDFNIHHRTGLLILVELIDLVNSVIFLLKKISNNLTQLVNFPTQIPDFDSHSPALLDSLLSSHASICFTMAFPTLGNPDHVVVSVFIHFPSYSQCDALFHHITYDYSCVN